MSIINEQIKELCTITIKSRLDNYTDQYHRIFMTKLAMASSILFGVNWLKDTMSCIIPEHHRIDAEFVSQACWIQGFFIYKELSHIPGVFGYYGIPTKLIHNGYYPAIGKYDTLEPCEVSETDEFCKPMSKTFYLQYQWFPFYLAALGLLYYLPYILYRNYNTDIISLNTNLESPEVDVQGLIRNYFDHGVNPVFKMRLIVAANIFIKILYILVNIIAFFGTNILVNGDFKMYGMEWLKWSKQPNEIAYDYTSTPKGASNPASVLLPTFGLCQILELEKDLEHKIYNKHQFVCEISQNILYQYVLLVLWFMFMIGLAISVIGLFIEVGYHLFTFCAFMAQGDQGMKGYKMLSIRECQYLDCIRKRDMTIYGKVIRNLKKGLAQLNNDDNEQYDNVMASNNPYTDRKKLLNEMDNVRVNGDDFG